MNSICRFHIGMQSELNKPIVNFRGIFNGEADWKTNLLYPIFPIVGPRNSRNQMGGTPGMLN